MSEKGSGEHFRVECKIDGVWFDSEYVFPTKSEALAFQRKEEAYGSGNSYRIVVTSDPVNLPPVKGEGDEEEDGSSSEDGPSSSSFFDWSVSLDLAALCPLSVRGAGDGDLDRVYSQCQHGCLEGRVFS